MTAGEKLVERLSVHFGVVDDVDLATKIGTHRQNIYSMRQRKKADINYNIIMMLLEEVKVMRETQREEVLTLILNSIELLRNAK